MTCENCEIEFGLILDRNDKNPRPYRRMVLCQSCRDLDVLQKYFKSHGAVKLRLEDEAASREGDSPHQIEPTKKDWVDGHRLAIGSVHKMTRRIALGVYLNYRAKYATSPDSSKIEVYSEISLKDVRGSKLLPRFKSCRWQVDGFGNECGELVEIAPEGKRSRISYCTTFGHREEYLRAMNAQRQRKHKEKEKVEERTNGILFDLRRGIGVTG